MAKVEYLGPKTEKRLTLEQWLRREGFTRGELIREMSDNDCAPALCTCGAWVELDGTCQHGNPSAVLSMI